MSGILFSIILVMFGLFQALALPMAAAQESQAVKLRFAGAVNGAAFECGKNYSNIGTTKSTITPSDFRFFVSEVELLTQEGKAVPLALDQDGVWQHKNVALVDLEDGSGPCSNGTKAIRAEVSGSAPRGNYTGVRFTMGVPFELNHGDPTVAPSPLNITAMFWNWQGGYKFLKADMNSTGLAAKPAMRQTAAGHGDKASQAQGGHGDGETSGFSVHLGSTMCAGASRTESPSACKNPNRVSVTFN
ncbi:MAG TPA: MbnP family copper-binding protein, partial [Candidatus Binatia bacterium]|nr:MbnP family copper-binding protein [Candidatus Binatia bacterium]